MKDTQNITKETFNTYHDLMKNNNRETKTLAFKLIHRPQKEKRKNNHNKIEMQDIQKLTSHRSWKNENIKIYTDET